MHLNRKNISEKMLKDAIIETSKHRNTFEIINNEKVVTEIIKDIEKDKNMQNLWKNYQKEYEYAKDGLDFESDIDKMAKNNRLLGGIKEFSVLNLDLETYIIFSVFSPYFFEIWLDISKK